MEDKTNAVVEKEGKVSLLKRLKSFFSWNFGFPELHSSNAIQSRAAIIQARSAQVIVLLTLAYVIITGLILNQQRREERIQYSAYLSINEMKIEPSPGNTAHPYKLIFSVINNGQTPATDVKIAARFSFNNKTDSIKGFGLIGPGQNNIYSVDTNNETLMAVNKGSNRFIILEVGYIDYSGQNHKLINEIMTSKLNEIYQIEIHRQFFE